MSAAATAIELSEGSSGVAHDPAYTDLHRGASVLESGLLPGVREFVFDQCLHRRRTCNHFELPAGTSIILQKRFLNHLIS